MNIIQDFIPAGRKNRPGKVNTMKYITIHNTGNSGKGANAKSHAAYIKSPAAYDTVSKNAKGERLYPAAPVSWHYSVDDTVIYQHLPDGETAYHAGDGANGTGNSQSIGIEICMNSDGNLVRATDNAVGLVVSLCLKYKIPADNVRQHNSWTGKNCPQMIRSGRPYNWEMFLAKVKAGLNSSANVAPAATPPKVPAQNVASSATPDANSVDVALVVKHASDIIFANEGNLGSVNKNDNGALSIGKMQWHASRALALMKSIVGKNVPQAKSVLGDAFYNEITSAVSTAWNNRVVTADEAAKLSALLVTAQGVATQNVLAKADIALYVQKGISYGIRDTGALVYFADGVNQYGTNSVLWRTIATNAIKNKGDVSAMFAATKALTTDYISRREKVYKAVVALNLGGAVGGNTPIVTAPTFKPYGVKVTADALNIRRGPGTNYATCGVIKDKGVYTITEEANGAGATKWGRLKSGAGWISLDFCKRI